MNDDDLSAMLQKTSKEEAFHFNCPEEMTIEEQPSRKRSDVVIAEIPVSNTQLHKIATGECCSLGKEGELFSIRFLLKNSFKARNSNFVVNSFIMQIVAVGKDNAMRKEDIAVKTKIKTVIKEKTVKAKKSQVQFKTKTEDKEEIF